MRYNYSNTTEKNIYPGNYVPMLTEEQLKSSISKNAGEQIFYLPVNIAETESQFRLEIAVPGVRREEFFIRADKNDLSIKVVHPHHRTGQTNTQAGYTCFDQHIVLPKNADAEFSCAEYSNGLLKLHLHKSTSPVHNVHTTIPVY